MSSDAQIKGTSLKRQLESTRQYASSQGLDLNEASFTDMGVSGFKGVNYTDGNLGRFKDAIVEKTIPSDCVLIVESLDRLSRQPATVALAQLIELLNLGVEIHTLFDRQVYTKNNINDTSMILTSIISMARAHEESLTKSKRSKSNWDLKRKNITSKILTRTCPQWLEPKQDRTGFKIIGSHAKTIRYIYDLYTSRGLGVFAITRELNKNITQYPSISKKVRTATTTGWHQSYVLKILKNPAVIGSFQPHIMKEGKRQAHGDVVKNYYPAVITQNQFDAAQSLLQTKRGAGGGRKGKAFTNPFTKMLKCGFCNGPIHLFNKGATKKGGHYLQCANAKTKKGCHCAAWNFKDFQLSFLTFFEESDLSAVVSNPKDKKKLDQLNQEKIAIEKRVQDAAHKLDILIDKSFSSLSKEMLAEKVNQISHDKAEDEKALKDVHMRIAELRAIKKPADLQKRLQKLKETVTSATPDGEEARQIIHQELSLTLHQIDLYTYYGNYRPISTTDELSQQLETFGRKNLEINKLLNKFSSVKGRDLYYQMNRFMVLKFKNGDIRITTPAIYKSILEKASLRGAKKKYAFANLKIAELKTALKGDLC